MNKIDFSHPGGFPLETDTLDFLQNSLAKPLQALAQLGGDNYILCGVLDDGFRASDGWVVINGEILPFKSALKQSTIVVLEDSKNVFFENGKSRSVYHDRYVTFGTGLQAINFASLPRISDLQQQKKRAQEMTAAHDSHKQDLKKVIDLMSTEISTLQAKVAPFTTGGGMVLWQKPANLIPAGWREVTDWRGRMPMGWDAKDADFDTVGKNGGTKQTYIEKKHLPKIQLETNLFYNSQDYDDGRAPANNIGINDSKKPIKTEPLGDGKALDIMNPYRVVLFIEYVGLTKN